VIERAEAAERAASTSAADASSAIDRLLGIIQMVGVLIAVVAGIGGFVFVLREARERSVDKARKAMDEAVEEFKQQFDPMTTRLNDLQTRVENFLSENKTILDIALLEMRETTRKANLALSLVPLGERQYLASDYLGAIDTYRRCLELDPELVVAQYKLGYVYTQAGKLEEAQLHLTRALEIEPEFALALAALGYVKRRIADKLPDSPDKSITFNEAERLMLQGLMLSPKLIDEDGESWWASLGGLYRRRGQIEQAIFAYTKAAEATPLSSYVHGILALLYAQTGNLKEMIDVYERVELLARSETQLNEDNYWAHADLLTARLALGKFEKAEDSLISVVTTVPLDDGTALEMLIDSLKRLKQILKDEPRSKQIASFIGRIEEVANTKKAIEASEQ
jgi:tetratricopeptide (TPR) repeat protein